MAQGKSRRASGSPTLRKTKETLVSPAEPCPECIDAGEAVGVPGAPGPAGGGLGAAEGAFGLNSEAPGLSLNSEAFGLSLLRRLGLLCMQKGARFPGSLQRSTPGAVRGAPSMGLYCPSDQSAAPAISGGAIGRQ